MGVACNEGRNTALVGGTASISVGTSITNLVPQLGWSESGMIDRNILTVDRIVIKGRELARTEFHAPLLGGDGKYSYQSVFEDESWRVVIFAEADSRKATELLVTSLSIGLQWTQKSALEQPALPLYEDIVLGRSKYDKPPTLSIGKPVSRERIVEQHEWSIETSDMQHHLRLQYDGTHILAIVQWLNRDST